MTESTGTPPDGPRETTPPPGRIVRLCPGEANSALSRTPKAQALQLFVGCNLCNIAICPDAQAGIADVGDWNEGRDSLDERLLPKRHSRLDRGAHWLLHKLRFVCGDEIKV